VTTLTSSVNNLNIAGNLSMTSISSGSNTYNSTFKLTAGTLKLTGFLQTTNSAGATSTFTIVPASAATLQLVHSTPLLALSGAGTNVVTLNNAGATVQYSGASQTVYTSASISGLPGGVSYQNLSFSGTGVKTATAGNLNIAGDFTNTMANDASNYVQLSNATVNFNGSTQSLAGGGGNGTTFYQVTFSGVGTKTMTSGNFNIATTGVLTMNGTCSCNVLAANGNLTLLSNANGSASVAAITGPQITGDVNVQRYITGGTGYRFYRLASSPVYAGTVGSNNVISLNYLQNSIYLTGSAGGGFDKTGNPTLYLYREDMTPSNASFVSGNFWGISAINNTPAYNYLVSGSTASGTFTIPAGNGYFFFFRGNRAAASLATETQTSFTSAPTVTMTATGTLNQGQIVVHDWYTPSSADLGYTGSGTGTNYIVRGFNMVGNPYASSIDWEQFNTTSTTTGIYGSNVSNTIYELNPATTNYDVYQQGGAYTNHGRRTIVSGQGFFVRATGPSAQLIFNESAKTVNQNTGLNLFMDTKTGLATAAHVAPEQHIRLQMAMDSLNTDDTYIGFRSSSKSEYVENEDAIYQKGAGKVGMASYSSDNTSLAINKMPLPGAKQETIPLYVSARSAGEYNLNMTELSGIDDIYEVWLIDHYKKDSVNMRKDTSYAFTISSDTSSYGSKRFELVLRQNDSLAVKLISFTGVPASDGSHMQWVTANEENYTHFTLERSNDNGVTYSVIDGITSSSQGTYNFLDRSHPDGTNLYRLKIEDLNGNISYSNIVVITYAYANSQYSKISLYPNPTKGPINLTINTLVTSSSTIGPLINSGINPPVNTNKSTYDIKIVSALGIVIKTFTTTNTKWQTDVSDLMPGTYILQVINKSDNTLVGQATFIKL
jgi:hypothetical protein